MGIGDVRRVHEVRVPKVRGGTWAGYFDDPEILAREVVKIDGTVGSIYITLNPVEPALFARAANRIKKLDTTTADKDVIRRRWMLIDFDPIRPSGISSTQQEHDRAINLACDCAWDWLRQFHWPEPVIADSGNGGHLLYALDAPNTRIVTESIERILKLLAQYVATDNVEVDVKVHNPARITKLYGTLACKGDSVPDRPHRRSCILEIPKKIIAVEIGGIA